MKKILWRVKLLIIVLLSTILLLPSNSMAITIDEPDTPSRNYVYRSYDYVIDKYDINLKLNENNTMDITETITAYFNVPKHGIYRTIPIINNVKRLDGTTSNSRAQVYDIKVNEEYTKSREDGDYKLQIGSEDETLTGSHTYKIKYTYNLGKDKTKDYDELYFNLIGTEWDTVIGNATFTITMPKEFDSSKLGFSSGAYGSTENDKIEYVVNDNKITGRYNGILRPGEALTVRCELPEGYFVGAGYRINIFLYILYLIPILFIGISIFLWYKFGRDDKVVETVEFYPPEGLNSLDIGFLYKGKAVNKDVTSLLIYLANKGYLKISETEKKSILSKNKGFKITKLKDYDGNDKNEKIFFDGLFKKSTLRKANTNEEKVEEIEEVTSEDLYDNFYKTTNKILSNVNSKTNKEKIFCKSASNKIILIIIMIIISFIVITIPPLADFGEMYLLLFAVIFPGIGFTVLFECLSGGINTINVNGTPTNSSIGIKLFGLIWGLFFGGMPWAMMLLPLLLLNPIYLIGYLVGIGCIVGMFICLKYLPKRTQYGNEILGKILGFKNFLKTAEKEKLEDLVMENPTYFYDILPYTYVLGVSDKWIKKFETISMVEPAWYDSPSTFDIIVFNNFVNSTMASAENVMSYSAPSSSSSGGGFSGGGFSGGGSGGGGGGSW